MYHKGRKYDNCADSGCSEETASSAVGQLLPMGHLKDGQLVALLVLLDSNSQEAWLIVKDDGSCSPRHLESMSLQKAGKDIHAHLLGPVFISVQINFAEKSLKETFMQTFSHLYFAT